jgi:predicted DNA-binding protein
VRSILESEAATKGEAMKTMSLRLGEDLARKLAALATVLEMTSSELIREALEEKLERHQADKTFPERLAEAIERNREALELLSR